MMEKSRIRMLSLGKRNDTVIENEEEFPPLSTGIQSLVNGC